jgi:uncharacterized protein
MKTLIFTHEADTDGMGGAILGNLAFEKSDYVLCETHSINKEVMKAINNKTIYNYDLVFVTDLCIRKEVISIIENDEKLCNIFFVFDHHKSEIAEDTLNCPFIKLIVENDEGKCSGTSLFYDFLLEKGYLNKNIKTAYLVELIRRYDTWEWKTKYNDETPFKLKVLFDILGKYEFISNISEKLRLDKSLFTEQELSLIESTIEKTKSEVNLIISNMKIKTINENQVGIIEDMVYKYRNEVAETLRDGKDNISYVIMVMKDKNSVSFRSINKKIDVGDIAQKLGGKGHKDAASCPLSEKFYEFIK